MFKKSLLILLALMLQFGVLSLQIGHALTPDLIIHEGRLLNSMGVPITTSQTFRFSFWSSSDFVSTDVDVLGAIVTLSPNYAGWQEQHTITPETTGTFSVKLGSIVPLPQMDPVLQKYLQVEVKTFGAPDTSYELLDITGDGGIDTEDRKVIGSLPYAKLSDFAVGSKEDVFIIDSDNTIETAGTGQISLSFGQLLGKYLSYDLDNSTFIFNDNLEVDGNLNITGDATIDGTIIAGTGGISITDADGDLAVVDNFTYSNGTKVQQVLEDLDTEIGNITTDTTSLSGTTQNLFTLDTDDTGGDIALQFGTTLANKLYWDSVNNTFFFNNDLKIDGDLNVSGDTNIDGLLLTGTGNVTITDITGNLIGGALVDDSVTDQSIDFGVGPSQVGADDLTATDNFTYSNGTDVQQVLEDLDTEIGNINTDTTSLSGTTQNLFTLDTDDTGGDIALQFGNTLANQLYWDSINSMFVFNNDLKVDGAMQITGSLHTGTGQVQITDVFGNLDGAVIIADSVDDTALDFGTGIGQVSAADLPILDLSSYVSATTVEEYIEEVGQLMYERWSTGVVSGGLISDAGGSSINITAGSGYINYNTIKNQRITWPNITNFPLTFDGDNYIYIDSTGSVFISQIPPITGAKIFLGYLYTVQGNTDIGTIAPIRSYVGDYEHRLNSYLDMAIGPVSPSGNIASEIPGTLGLAISSGKIYNNLNLFYTVDSTDFVKWYNTTDFGWLPDVNGINSVNTRHYNDETQNSVNSLSGVSTFVNGSNTVTGAGTSYLTEVSDGDYIYLTADTRNAKTLVLSVDSNTQITLAVAYSGVGGAGTGIADKALKKLQTGYWKKDLVVRDMLGTVHYMYSQDEYATEDDAKVAQLPIIPQAIASAGIIYVASVITQEGDLNLTNRLYDIRPNFQRIFGYGTSGTVGTVPDHGSLLGLSDDDHILYFNTDGSDVMTGDLQMGTNNILNGVIDGDLNTLQDISWSSIKTRNKTIMLMPEYNSLLVSKDGTTNKVTLKQGTDSVNDHQYYVLTSGQPALNDIDLILKVQLPSDFVSWQATPLQISLKSQSINSTDNQIDVSMNDTSNTAITLAGATDLHSAVADTWIIKNITFTGTPTFTAGDFITLNLKLQSKDNNKIYISEILLNYIGK